MSVPIDIYFLNQDSCDEDDAEELTYVVERDEQNEFRIVRLKPNHGPSHSDAGVAPEAAVQETPDFDKSLLPNGGKISGLKLQRQARLRYWQMWYPDRDGKLRSK